MISCNVGMRDHMQITLTNYPKGNTAVKVRFHSKWLYNSFLCNFRLHFYIVLYALKYMFIDCVKAWEWPVQILREPIQHQMVLLYRWEKAPIPPVATQVFCTMSILYLQSLICLMVSWILTLMRIYMYVQNLACWSIFTMFCIKLGVTNIFGQQRTD